MIHTCVSEQGAWGDESPHTYCSLIGIGSKIQVR